jgi:hypothetical protein
VMPTRQALPIGAHGALVVHAVHAPALQTMSVPQGVPSLTLVAPVHVCWPVEHDVVPLWHGAPAGVHVTPAVQDTHAPPLHTLLTPQEVPSVALAFVSAQASPPSMQDAVPAWHGAPAGTQEAPAVQAWHAPFSQKRLAPHGIPFGAWPPGVHTGAPDAQAMDAAWQEPASLQSDPGVQPTHVPPAHTPVEPASAPASSSHIVPGVAGARVVQCVAPASSHVVTPIWQAAGVQILPGEQPVVWSAPASSFGPGPPSVVASTPASRSAGVPSWMPKRALHADTATARTTRSVAVVGDRASMDGPSARGRQRAGTLARRRAENHREHRTARRRRAPCS